MLLTDVNNNTRMVEIYERIHDDDLSVFLLYMNMEIRVQPEPFTYLRKFGNTHPKHISFYEVNIEYPVNVSYSWMRSAFMRMVD